ncbi:MAG: hypothetical protein KG028_03940 [Actinobacteria bacterium]|jgi:hypothetical protein|nr:hypothetical protein [Actinomycetota bacterium]
MAFVCDGCQQEHDGRRVVFSTEATDDHGVDVEVAKRWVTCPSCADDVFERIGMPSPWDDADGRTLTFPDEVYADAARLSGR